MFKTKNNKAQAMVVVFVYISVVSLLAIYLLTFASNLHNIVVREISHARAFYAAEAVLVGSLVDLWAGTNPAGKTWSFPVVAGGELISVSVTTQSIANPATVAGPFLQPSTRVTATVADWGRFGAF